MSTFVLVPGAGGSPWQWSRLAPLLESEGHRAIVVDLPGDHPDVGLERYIELVIEAVEAANSPVTLVALSFGAFSAAAAARRVPVERLMLINAMIPLPGESGARWWRSVGVAQAQRLARASSHRPNARSFDPLEQLFHDVGPDVLAEAQEHDRPQADVAFATPWPENGWPDVPTTVFVSEDDRLFPPELQRNIARDRLGLDVTMVAGGHLCVLSRPAEVVRALLAR